MIEIYPFTLLKQKVKPPRSWNIIWTSLSKISRPNNVLSFLFLEFHKNVLGHYVKLFYMSGYKVMWQAWGPIPLTLGISQQIFRTLVAYNPNVIQRVWQSITTYVGPMYNVHTFTTIFTLRKFNLGIEPKTYTLIA